MNYPEHVLSAAAGALLIYISDLVQMRVRHSGAGAAWCGASLLLGFVGCALAKNWRVSQHRPEISGSLRSIVLQVFCGFSLCFALPILFVPAASLIAAVSIVGWQAKSTTTPTRAAALVAVVCVLANMVVLSDGKGYVLERICATALLCPTAIFLSDLKSTALISWGSRRSLVAVVVLAVLGLLSNLVGVPEASKPRTSNITPLVLFGCGCSLYALIDAPQSFKKPVMSFGGAAFAALCIAYCNREQILRIVLQLVGAVIVFAALVVTEKRRNALKTRKSETSSVADLFSTRKSNGGEGNVLATLMSNPRERKLAIFLLLTVAIMLLELFYGLSVNSLGLISDSFHMMLDSASIAIGLYAAHAASWKPNQHTHPFGYARYEVLGGFINGVLLLFIAFYVMLESVERIIDPPEIEAQYLLLVSVIGLIVNIIGVVFFHEAHGHSHSHDHGHGCCSAGNHIDHNMRGVFLHILADLLGSVSVIVSSIFIYLFNFWIADPICSALSATLILMSAFPLLEETGKVLLMTAPPYHGDLCEDIRQQLLSSALVTEVGDVTMWIHSSAPRDLLVCALTGKTPPGTDYSRTRDAVISLVEQKVAHDLGVDNITVLSSLE